MEDEQVQTILNNDSIEELIEEGGIENASESE